MADGLAKITQFCQARVEDSLHAVFTYTADPGAIHYAREDFRDTYRENGLDAMHEAVWHVHTTILEEQPKIETFGEYLVPLHTFDRAFVLQFSDTLADGVAIVVDRDIGQYLHRFVEQCAARIEDGVVA